MNFDIHICIYCSLDLWYYFLFWFKNIISQTLILFYTIKLHAVFKQWTKCNVLVLKMGWGVGEGVKKQLKISSVSFVEMSTMRSTYILYLYTLRIVIWKYLFIHSFFILLFIYFCIPFYTRSIIYTLKTSHILCVHICRM